MGLIAFLSESMFQAIVPEVKPDKGLNNSNTIKNGKWYNASVSLYYIA
jgi:hypothetical protein